VADLALGDELGHRPDRLLDRRVGIDAVLVVEVDVIDAEALQRGIAGLAHILRVAAHAEELAVLAAHVGELRRQHDVVATVGDRLADELLVRERPVHVGGVDEVDAELERAVDRRDRLALVAGAVELRHPHAAEPLGRDLERRRAAAKCSPVHVKSSFVARLSALATRPTRGPYGRGPHALVPARRALSDEMPIRASYGC
jgi:hypothetical protein